jgi:hypothetical protein
VAACWTTMTMWRGRGQRMQWLLLTCLMRQRLGRARTLRLRWHVAVREPLRRRVMAVLQLAVIHAGSVCAKGRSGRTARTYGSILCHVREVTPTRGSVTTLRMKSRLH